MAYEWIVSTAVLVVGVGLVSVRRNRAPRLRGVDRELADLLDREAVEALRAELASGAMPVAVHTETGLRGPSLAFDAGDRRFRMCLYGETCLREDGQDRSPRLRRGSAASLLEIRDLRSHGWLVVLATERGRRRYIGWRIAQDLTRAPLRVDANR